MPEKHLEGLKIAVLVESQYIPAEIETYRRRFAEMGATVHLMAHLWGKPELTFLSKVDEAGMRPETLDIDLDVEEADPADYAAVIQSANYTSVRERFFKVDGPLSPSMVRSAPAVKFFLSAMRDPRIVKGALCHGLWILTPAPEFLANRRVICHSVVVADVYNAGGVYTPSPDGVVVDNDLVTGETGDHVDRFVEAIAKRIVEMRKNGEREPGAQPMAGDTAAPVAGSGGSAVQDPKRGNRRILVLLSEWGYWGEELVGPLEVFDSARYEVEFITPTGKRPNAISVSMDADYIDPPLARSVTSPAMAKKTRTFDDPNTSEGKRLERPISLASWFPERPYWSAPQFVRNMEEYRRRTAIAREGALRRYDALLIVGGSGPIIDLVNNQRVHDLILAFYRAGRPIAAECYGVACLAFARELDDRKSILWGKHVTGHCLEYDYKDGTSFMESRGNFLNFNMGPPPYPLEYILRDATGPEGGFHGNFGDSQSVIVDFPFITGRSTPDSVLTGELLVRALDGNPPLRRFGW